MTALRILAGVAVYVLALLACAFLVLSGLGAVATLLTGCGDTYNLGSAAVAPTGITPAPVTTPCAPPVTPSPGHTVFGHTYRVCVQPGVTQEVTTYTDTAADGPEWPAAPLPCVDPATITPGPCTP